MKECKTQNHRNKAPNKSHSIAGEKTKNRTPRLLGKTSTFSRNIYIIKCYDA